MGISSWFRAGLYDFYYNGLEIRSYCQSGVINKKGEWKLLFDKKFLEVPSDEFQRISIIPVMRIPFKNIVAYDLDGDEYYFFPHIYCRFAEGGSPYEEIVYRIVQEGARPRDLESELKIK